MLHFDDTRGVCRTRSNIYVGIFFQKYLTAKRQKRFEKRLQWNVLEKRFIVNVRVGSK